MPPKSTTTAQDALKLGKGVCQDHAHLFLACCHAQGIPARYVSGYIDPGNSDHAASHAWVDVWVEDSGFAGWISIDVTHAICQMRSTAASPSVATTTRRRRCAACGAAAAWNPWRCMSAWSGASTHSTGPERGSLRYNQRFALLAIMTYCVAMRLDAGLVFLSDSRTNAGIDNVGTFRKMYGVRESGRPHHGADDFGQPVPVAGYPANDREHVNADGQDHLERRAACSKPRRSSARRSALVHARDAKALEEFGIDFNVTHHLRRPDRRRGCRLFQVYSAGNFIESHDENAYFQIGESKYGKPIIDRVITPGSEPRRGRQVRADLDGLDAALEYLGRPAARPAGV